jgi:hypothetical protein
MQTSYESFGIECGEGWKYLYQPLIDLCNLKGVSIFQIKEKFGGLRFYTGACDADSGIPMLIRAVEAMSYKVCEDCGEYGVDWKDGKTIYKTTTGRSETSRWIRSLCDPCRKAFDNKRSNLEQPERWPCPNVPKYSGPNCSGVCICGHDWDDHHLGCVGNARYFEETKESYVPQECEYYGWNEAGGLDLEGKSHCHSYRDSKK